VKRAFAAAGFDTRVVHPSISRPYRQASDHDTKTDQTDLEAGIFRAAINGFGLQEAPRDPTYAGLQFWARHRRDLVHKETLLRCQILEELEACLPGYARCFKDIFNLPFAMLVPRHHASPAAVAAAGVEGLARLARLGRARVQQPTLLRILGWARDAADPDLDAELHRARLIALDDDRIDKHKQIHPCERELAAHLVQTPYVRLLALPGLHVVTAGELAGEAGPMANYATARVITGRACSPGGIRATGSTSPRAGWPAGATAGSARRCSGPPTPWSGATTTSGPRRRGGAPPGRARVRCTCGWRVGWPGSPSGWWPTAAGTITPRAVARSTP
jgi:transposase